MTCYISCESELLKPECQTLMLKYHLDYSESHLPRLHLSEQGIALLDLDGQSVALDWNDSQWKQRAKGGRGGDPLIKVTLAGIGATILDVTAGWGRDALIMAHAGGNLIMLEKNPYMAVLLDKAYEHFNDLTLKKRVQIHHIDAHLFLAQLQPSQYPDVIFIDPMHPKRQKKALVKKHLQVLQQFLLPNDDVECLIELAQQKCLKRVVVKWPEKEAPVIKPDFSVSGKTIRFDVYQVKK